MSEVLTDERAIPQLPSDPSEWDEGIMDERAEELLEMISQEWGSVTTTKNGTEICVMPPDKERGEPLGKVKAEADIAVSVKEAAAFLSDVSNMIKLDSGLKSSTVVQAKACPEGTVFDVRLGEWKTPWPIWDREVLWVFLSRERPGHPGSVLATSISVQSHPDVPLRDTEVVRAVLTHGLQLIEPRGDNACHVTYITSVDPMGWLPAAVVNMMLKDNGKVIAAAKDALERN